MNLYQNTTAVASHPHVSHSSSGSAAAPTYTANYTYDRYAKSIIGDSPALYDALEIHGVRDLFKGAGIDGETFCEIDNVHPEFFSVYVHAAEGEGIECVGDFSNYLDAVRYANELSNEYGWPVANHIHLQFMAFASREMIDVESDDLVDAFPLSCGRTLFRRIERNGSKTAFFMDRRTATEEEWEEFTRILKRNKQELN